MKIKRKENMVRFLYGLSLARKVEGVTKRIAESMKKKFNLHSLFNMSVKLSYIFPTIFFFIVFYLLSERLL